MLKNYYVEAFEILSSVLPIFMGLQNIINRGDRNKFNEETQSKFKRLKIFRTMIKRYKIKEIK